MARPRRKKRPVQVFEVLSKIMADLGDVEVKRTGQRALEVFQAFESVGPPITEHAEPALFRGGVLTLRVSGSPWLNELSFMETQLKARINSALGREVVEGLRFRLGNVRPRRAPVPPLRALNRRERAEVEGWTSEIANDAVREAVARAAASSLARGPREGPIPEGPPGPRVCLPKVEPEPEPTLSYGWGGRKVDRWNRGEDD